MVAHVRCPGQRIAMVANLPSPARGPRGRPGANRVRWLHTDAAGMPQVQVDLVPGPLRPRLPGRMLPDYPALLRQSRQLTLREVL